MRSSDFAGNTGSFHAFIGRSENQLLGDSKKTTGTSMLEGRRHEQVATEGGRSGK